MERLYYPTLGVRTMTDQEEQLLKETKRAEKRAAEDISNQLETRREGKLIQLENRRLKRSRKKGQPSEWRRVLPGILSNQLETRREGKLIWLENKRYPRLRRLESSRPKSKHESKQRLLVPLFVDLKIRGSYSIDKKGGKRPPPFSKSDLHTVGQRFRSNCLQGMNIWWM